MSAESKVNCALSRYEKLRTPTTVIARSQGGNSVETTWRSRSSRRKQFYYIGAPINEIATAYSCVISFARLPTRQAMTVKLWFKALIPVSYFSIVTSSNHSIILLILPILIQTIILSPFCQKQDLPDF